MSDLVAFLRERLADAAIEPGRFWYRALDPDGKLWCESSNPDEVTRSIRGRKGYTLERLPCYIVHTPWEEWRP